MAVAPGEEPFYTAYAVPDFDSTADVVPVTLRPSNGGTATLEDLTPGSYHVYVFNSTARLEYRDRSALASAESRPTRNALRWNHVQPCSGGAGTMMPTNPISIPKTPGAPVILSEGRSGDRSRRICVSSFCGMGGKPQTLAHFIVLTALLAIARLPAHPQTNPPATRPSSAPGLYRIAGKVLNSVTGEPVRRATVSVLAEPDSHTIASTITDSDGHFALENLPAAKYQLTASRRGFRTAFYDEHDEYSIRHRHRPRPRPGDRKPHLPPHPRFRPPRRSHSRRRRPSQRRGRNALPQAAGPQAGRSHRPGRLNHHRRYRRIRVQQSRPRRVSSGRQSRALVRDPPLRNRFPPKRPTPPLALDVAYPITYFDSTSDEAQASPILLSGGNREEADFNLHAVPALHITLEAPRADDGSSPSYCATLHQSIFGVR